MQFTIKLVAQTLFSKFLAFLNESKGKNSLSDYVHILLHYFESFLAHCVSSTAHKNNRTSGGRTFLCCSPCCFGLSKDTKTSTTTYKPAAKSNNHNSNENNKNTMRTITMIQQTKLKIQVTVWIMMPIIIYLMK